MSQVVASGNDVIGESQPPLPLTLCDLPGASGADEHQCAASMLEPEGAKLVNKLGETEDAVGQMEPIDTAPASTPLISDAPLDTSATAHADLPAGEARVLFESTYGPLLDGLENEPLQSRSEVLAMTSDTTAVLDEGSGSDGALLDSSAPLVTGPNDRLVDLELERTADGFEPKRPLVDVRLPDAAYEPAELGGSEVGLSFAPSGQERGDGPAARHIGDEGLFYAEVESDTDLFLTPSPAGFEVFTQLRSADSPTVLTIDVDAPDGASLHEAAPGSGMVEIRRGDRTLAVVTPPVALDAEGAPVGATMSMKDATTLRIEVDHRGSGAAYPILVDPEVYDTYVWGWGEDFAGWVADESDSDFIQWAFGPNPTFPAGIYNQVAANAPLSAASISQWRYRVPGHGASAPNTTAYIADAYFGSSTFATGTTSQTRPYVALGTLSSASGEWIRHKTFNQAYTHPGAWLSEWNAPLAAGTSPIQATQLDFRLTTSSPSITPNTTRSSWLTAAVVKLSDWDTPTSEIEGLGGWTDGSEPQMQATVRGKDLGLGVKTQGFVSGFDEDGESIQGPAPSVTSSCAGGVRAPCPKNWAHPFTMPVEELRDGLQVAISGSIDALGKGALGGAWYGIDRAEPDVAEVATEELSDGGLRIDVAALDGDAGSRDAADQENLAAAESGVKSIELLIDGQRLSPSHFVQQQCDGDGVAGNGDPATEIPWQSCPMDAQFTVAPASNTPDALLSLVVVDGAGNRTVVDPRIVHAKQYSGNPAAGGILITEEWISPATGDSRVDDGEIITTRTTVPCDASLATTGRCLQMRQLSELDGDEEAHSIYTGTSEEDPGIKGEAPIAEATDVGGPPSGQGPITDVMEAWQSPPPGHGTTYERYETVRSEGGDDGSEGDEPQEPFEITDKVWTDAETGLPLMLRSTGPDGVLGTTYYTYGEPVESESVPTDFFAVASDDPDPALTQEVTLIGADEAGVQVDQETGEGFVPYYLGDETTIGPQDYCLAGSEVANTSETTGASTPGDVADDPENALDSESAELETTTVAASYAAVDAGESCEPGEDTAGGVAFEFFSEHKSSDEAEEWRELYRDEAEAIDADPEADPETGGVMNVVVEGDERDAYAIPADGWPGETEQAPGETVPATSVLIVGPTQITITGDFEKADVQEMVDELEPQ